MKATLHVHLAGQPTLTTLVPSARWFRAGAVVDTPIRPFVVFRWLAPVAGDARGTFAHQLRLDVHDNRGSYARIEDFLKAAKPIMLAIKDLTGSDGRISQCDYLGNGGDQEDETYKTNYSFGSWQIVGREA